MAYNNEFPHFEADKLNLDWILEQYSTFNRKIQEIRDYFDETVQGVTDHYEQIFTEFSTSINDSFADFTSDITQSFNSLSNSFDIFRNDINEAISTFETNITTELNSYETTVNGRLASQDQILANATASFQRQLDAMESDIVAYIRDNMAQWQVEASKIIFYQTADFGASATMSCDLTHDEILAVINASNNTAAPLQIQAVSYSTGRRVILNVTKGGASSDIVLQGVFTNANGEYLEGTITVGTDNSIAVTWATISTNPVNYVDVTVPLTQNTETHGDYDFQPYGLSTSKQLVILGVSTATGSSPIINHFAASIKNNEVYPKVNTTITGGSWHITIYDYETTTSSSRTYRVFYTTI